MLQRTRTTIAVPDRVDDLDLLAPEVQDRRIFGECSDCFSVIEKQHKYMWCQKEGGELLFDLNEDPYETHDLISTDTHRAVADSMRAYLIASLSQRNHPAVVDGKLKAHPPGPTGGRRSKWPGFHSTDVATDVLH